APPARTMPSIATGDRRPPQAPYRTAAVPRTRERRHFPAPPESTPDWWPDSCRQSPAERAHEYFVQPGRRAPDVVLRRNLRKNRRGLNRVILPPAEQILEGILDPCPIVGRDDGAPQPPEQGRRRAIRRRQAEDQLSLGQVVNQFAGQKRAGGNLTVPQRRGERRVDDQERVGVGSQLSCVGRG